MHDFAVEALWIYIILLLIGGLFGFLKAGSKVSLATSTVAAVVLILTTLPHIFDPGFASLLANVVLVVLLVVFAMRLGKTKKFMPSGLLLLLTIAVLAVRNIHPH
jgi:uncharacterized membrane protein (UPF0136 family)